VDFISIQLHWVGGLDGWNGILGVLHTGGLAEGKCIASNQVSRYDYHIIYHSMLFSAILPEEPVNACLEDQQTSDCSSAFIESQSHNVVMMNHIYSNLLKFHLFNG
jgi:hypothetical protein